MLYQLRIYTIAHGHMGEWLADWRAMVVPLRRQFGFEVTGAWTIDESDRFVWVLRYSGRNSWAEADANYYGSQERAALSPDPARHISHSEHWLMHEATSGDSIPI